MTYGKVDRSGRMRKLGGEMSDLSFGCLCKYAVNPARLRDHQDVQYTSSLSGNRPWLAVAIKSTSVRVDIRKSDGDMRFKLSRELIGPGFDRIPRLCVDHMIELTC